MKKRIGFALFALGFISNSLVAQEEKSVDKYIESELVSLAGKDGVSWKSQAGDFLFKPYLLVQTRGIFNYYDDEGLSLAEQDNILNSGFGVPFALVGFAGKAFDKVTFNLAINATGKGDALLNQAWFDINVKDEFRFRIGKFKTPFNSAYLVRIGQTLTPVLPMSLSTPVNIPFSINAANPVLATGFDIGVMAHGLVAEKLEYQLGVFNGTGITQNAPTNTTSDDFGIPSLLYSGRLAFMPMGKMPLHQGDPGDLEGKYLSFAASSSYNVEANFESSNDLRFGFEVAMLWKRLFFSAEAYTLDMNFVERQQITENYKFGGGYAQLGYFVTKKLQPALRFDVMDRNSLNEDGLLYLPGVGMNYYIIGHNLKLQAFYQQLKKSGHEDLFKENDDDNGMPEHMGVLQFQFAF